MDFKRLMPIYLAAVIGPIGGAGVIPLLPVLARNWNIHIQWVSLTITFYMIPFVVFQLFSGSIAHVFRTRTTLLFGFGTYSLGGFLAGISPNLGSLLASRFVQGLGAAFIHPIVFALVGELVEPKNMGKAMGMLGVTYTAGVTMGPLISGLLEVSLGWSWYFFFLMALSLSIGAFYALVSFREGPGQTRTGHIGDAFELVKKSLSYAGVRFISLAAFALLLGYIGLMTFVADYLKESFSLRSDKLGLILSMTGFSGILTSPIAGFLGDRFGRTSVAVGGGVLMIIAVLGLAMVQYTYSKYLWLFFLFGVGSATTWTSLNTLAVELIPHLRKPVSSVYNSFKYFGYALSPLVLSLLYVPFSIFAVYWAVIVSILVSLFLVTRLRSPAG